MTGLEPRGFTWVISGRLAVAERVGGHGFQHRRVRREEEIAWLKGAGVDTVLSLLPGNQNLASYAAAGLTAVHEPLAELEPAAAERVFATLRSLLRDRRVVLVHRDTIDDAVAGILAGYLVYSGLVDDPIKATALIQEILRRPLGPEARAIIPQTAGA
ncbi:MAG: hypothetical protein JW785_05320 [Acidimicrobiia bacterium]|nr:hypothetical protein [Acidimicrobiia bacterium]